MQSLHLSLFVLCLLTTTTLSAQANWQTGHIIRNGERTNGQIDDREWRTYFDSFRFRTGEGAVRTYGEAEGVDFGVEGRRYVSREVTIPQPALRLVGNWGRRWGGRLPGSGSFGASVFPHFLGPER